MYSLKLLFIIVVFNDALNTVDFITSNDGMVIE